MKIENLNFSVRVYNCLKRAGIDTEEQLKRMSDEDLMCLRNFGTTCLTEVRRKIAQPAMTNGDRIRRMTDEELAVFLLKVEQGDFTADVCFEENCPWAKCPDDCTGAAIRWLQRPAEVKDY